MNVLIVYAHPEPQSFNAAMKNLAVVTLTGLGATVEVSDLYAMGFKAAADQTDFTEEHSPFNYMKAQRAAARGTGTFAPDIQREQEKLFWSNLVIFQFPLWWRSMPAIMKGYVDRVFASGVVYGQGARSLTGRRAMLALTTSGPVSPGEQAEADRWLSDNLAHIHEGMLQYVGLDVLPPFAIWGPTSVPAAERQAYLDRYRERLTALVEHGSAPTVGRR